MSSTSAEFRYLNQWLTTTAGNLLDLMDMDEDNYRGPRLVPRSADTRLANPILYEVRRIVRGHLAGR